MWTHVGLWNRFKYNRGDCWRVTPGILLQHSWLQSCNQTEEEGERDSVGGWGRHRSNTSLKTADKAHQNILHYTQIIVFQLLKWNIRWKGLFITFLHILWKTVAFKELKQWSKLKDTVLSIAGCPAKNIIIILWNPTRYLPRGRATNLCLISGISLAWGIRESWASCCGFGPAYILE